MYSQNHSPVWWETANNFFLINIERCKDEKAFEENYSFDHCGCFNNYWHNTLFCRSILFVNRFIDGQRKDAGLTIKSVNIPDFKLSMQRRNRRNVIMVHGFGLNKDAWLAVAKHLTPNYRVIIPDLPGLVKALNLWTRNIASCQRWKD